MNKYADERVNVEIKIFNYKDVNPQPLLINEIEQGVIFKKRYAREAVLQQIHAVSFIKSKTSPDIIYNLLINKDKYQLLLDQLTHIAEHDFADVLFLVKDEDKVVIDSIEINMASNQ